MLPGCKTKHMPQLQGFPWGKMPSRPSFFLETAGRRQGIPGTADLSW